MNIDYSGLLQLFKNLNSSSYAYIMKSDDPASLISASNKVDKKEAEAIVELNKIICNDKADNLSFTKIELPQKFKELFPGKNVNIFLLTECESIYFCLIDISSSTKKEIQNNKNLEIIIESLKREIKLNYQLNEKLALTFSKINSVIYTYDLSKNRYDFISNSAEKILGYTNKEITENRLLLIRRVNSESYPLIKEFKSKWISGEAGTIDYEFINKKGKRLFLHHSVEPIVRNGRVEKIVGAITDITKEKEIINKLEKSEKRFGVLINTAIDFIFSLNGFGYLLQVNENGANALGFRSEEMLGKHFLDFAVESQRNDISKSFQKMLSSNKTVHFEIDLLHSLNRPIRYEFLATPLIENGTITGMLGIGRDVSIRRKNEEEIERLNKKLKETHRLVEIERDRAKQQITVLEELNILKNEFISNVSHELRTPLASIVGFAETLASDEDLERDLVTEFSEIILTEGKRLARFIEDILDFSELESGGANLEKQDINIVRLITTVSENFKNEFEEKNITFTALIPEAEIIIFADEEKLVKAFNTILENTLRFTKEGDSVSVVIQDFLKEVEIVISDDGDGISEDDLELLFDKFHSSGSTNLSTPTAGIALSLVKQIFEHHKGLLQVKSGFGEGTTFIIRLPKKLN